MPATTVRAGTPIMVYLTPDEKTDLQQHCKETNTSMTRVVRSLVRGYLAGDIKIIQVAVGNVKESTEKNTEVTNAPH